ncbi:MAG: acetylornithine deacetylase/succinyl-diaminopimelate desuccinylase family protein [Kiritimatiellia bacterium]|jgi:acetylornithine deacetylase/succinyl-diaminopimelate desuccinylase family protein
MDDLIALLQQLVGTPSVNPEDEDDPSLAGEGRMAEVLEAHLIAKGFRVEKREVSPGRPNIIARFGPDKPTRTLAIEGHLDTVSIRNMCIEPFAGKVRDGRVYGRGACDMKGPMAAALHALQPDILQRIADAGRQIMFVGCIDEEKGARGATALVASGFQADEIIVLEPTCLNLVVAHKAPCWFTIEIGGISGHGANPERGVNAIEGMMKAIHVLKQLHEQRQPQIPHALLGVPTMNIGKIIGGRGTNIIPDHCCIEVDYRILPDESLAELIDTLNNQLDRLVEQGVIHSSKVTLFSVGSAFQTDSEAPLVHRLRAACTDEDVHPEIQGTSWFSDAGPLSTNCEEIVVFGPGDIAQAHTKDEFIELAELEKGHRIFTRLLERFAHDG